MIWLLVFAFIALCLTYGAYWLSAYPGLIILRMGGEQIEASLWVGLIGILIFIFGGYLCIALIKRLLSFPQWIRYWWQSYRQEHALEDFHRSITALHVKDYKAVAKYGERAHPILERTTFANVALLAYQAYKQDKYAAVMKYAKALNTLPGANALSAFWQGCIAYKKCNDGEARKHLESFEQQYGPSPKVSTKLLYLEVRNHAYEAALKHLYKLYQQNAFPFADYNQRKAQLLFAKHHHLDKKPSLQDSLELIEEIHGLAPSFLPATLLLVRLAKAKGNNRRAIKLIEYAWSITPHPELAEHYYTLKEATSSSCQFKALQELSSQRPSILAKIYTAPLSLESGMYGVTRNLLKSLEQARALTVRMCLLGATLEAAEGNKSPHKWQEKACQALPDPGWHCQHCHTSHNEWVLQCSSCGHLFTLAWGVKGLSSIL